MVIRYLVLAVCLWFFAISAWAQMYQYRDENGNLRFTDDLTQVPRSQHETFKTMFSFKNSPQINETTESVPAESDKGIGTDSENCDVKKNAQSLNQTKEELDNIYKALQEKRASIQAANPSEDASPEEFNDFRKMVSEFNAQVESYQKRQEEFEKQAREFNAWVMQSNAEQRATSNE